MATTTNHLGLTLPAGTEPVSLQVLNDNWRKTEAGVLKALRGKAAYNLLDNSDFVIAQAGYGGRHGNVRYACDRWKNTYEFGTFEKVADGIRMTYKTNNCYMTQYLSPDVIARLNGRKVTLALCLSGGNVIAKSATFDNSKTTIHITQNNLTLDLQKNAVQIVVTSDSATICWVALYEGEYTADTLPEYVPKGYATELAECLRYYRRSFDGTSATGQYGYQHFVAGSVTSGPATVFDPPMRIKPTVTIYNPNTGTAGSIRGWNSTNIDECNILYSTRYGFSIGKSSSLNIGIVYAYHYEASADL